MSSWPKQPILYEINAWTWLRELSLRSGSPVTLANVPAAEWDTLAARGFDAVWLMGVWERSPKGIDVALATPGLMDDFRRALPDFQPKDVVGSPYCIRDYVVDFRLGGPAGLASARAELRKRNMLLLLDFVPNHVAPDHPWTETHPEYFITGTPEEMAQTPGAFQQVGDKVIACGRDPFFPPWPDVLQLNAFHPGLRRAVRDTLAAIAGQADSVRCDMAMLFINDIFAKTWGARAGDRPEGEYWREIIASVKSEFPGFLFAAEAYWGMEWELQQQGFDYCYDKRLYDRLLHDQPEDIRLHLTAEPAYQERLLRFLENHDEPRARAVFEPAREMAAAVIAFTIPGAKLFHEGQAEGRGIRLPVFLGRRPDEADDAEMLRFYHTLLETVAVGKLCSGAWSLCESSGWPDNQSSQNILAWTWTDDARRHAVVVNYSALQSQARIHLPWTDLGAEAWRLNERLSGQTFERYGGEMTEAGLYVDLAPWRCYVLSFEHSDANVVPH